MSTINFAALPRLAGYYLYVSNSSVSKTDGHLCYHHTGSTLPDKLQDVNCNHLGKNVIFYNERDKDNIPTGYSDIAMLELCHVEIYGNYYNLNCKVSNSQEKWETYFSNFYHAKKRIFLTGWVNFEITKYSIYPRWIHLKCITNIHYINYVLSNDTIKTNSLWFDYI